MFAERFRKDQSAVPSKTKRHDEISRSRSATPSHTKHHHGPSSTRKETSEKHTTTVHHHTSKDAKPTKHVSTPGIVKHRTTSGVVPVSLSTSTSKPTKIHKPPDSSHPLPLIPMDNTVSISTLSTSTLTTTSMATGPTRASNGTLDSAGIPQHGFTHLTSIVIAVLIVFTLLLFSCGGIACCLYFHTPHRRRKAKSWFSWCKCFSLRTKATNLAQAQSQPNFTQPPRVIFSPQQNDFVLNNLHNQLRNVNPPPTIPTVPYSTTQPNGHSEVHGNGMARNISLPQVARSESLIGGATRTAGNSNPYTLPPSTFNNGRY